MLYIVLTHYPTIWLYIVLLSYFPPNYVIYSIDSLSDYLVIYRIGPLFDHLVMLCVVLTQIVPSESTLQVERIALGWIGRQIQRSVFHLIEKHI